MANTTLREVFDLETNTSILGHFKNVSYKKKIFVLSKIICILIKYDLDAACDGLFYIHKYTALIGNRVIANDFDFNEYLRACYVNEVIRLISVLGDYGKVNISSLNKSEVLGLFDGYEEERRTMVGLLDNLAKRAKLTPSNLMIQARNRVRLSLSDFHVNQLDIPFHLKRLIVQ
jgi:hypothetical protein